MDGSAGQRILVPWLPATVPPSEPRVPGPHHRAPARHIRPERGRRPSGEA